MRHPESPWMCAAGYIEVIASAVQSRGELRLMNILEKVGVPPYEDNIVQLSAATAVEVFFVPPANTTKKTFSSQYFPIFKRRRIPIYSSAVGHSIAIRSLKDTSMLAC